MPYARLVPLPLLLSCLVAGFATAADATRIPCEDVLLISTGSEDYLPAAEVRLVLGDDSGAGTVAVRAGTEREGRRLAYFDITIGRTRIHLKNSLRAVEKAYGPIDLANLRVFRTRGEFWRRGDPVGHDIEFGFLAQYEDEGGLRTLAYALPWCTLRLSGSAAESLTCNERGEGGVIDTRVFRP